LSNDFNHHSTLHHRVWQRRRRSFLPFADRNPARKQIWLNLLWASLICTFGSALFFLIRWFVQSQESEFATMGHLSPFALLFTLLSFFFWVPLFALAMFGFSFAALSA